MAVHRGQPGAGCQLPGPLVGAHSHDDPDTRREAPKSDPRYYYRPWKTILVRTVADGGESFYVQGDHRATLPQLRRAALAAGA